MLKKYFEGYYFKCCEGKAAFALIPALHQDGKRKSASLQIITREGAYVIPYKNIWFGDNCEIKLGKNRFSEKGILLNACSNECRAYGKLYFGEFHKIASDIMGPFQYLPFMQCRHSVLSMCHLVRGKVHINGRVYSFKNGVGYVEGDRGRSFPKEYIWTQCHFQNGSLMLAVADIPLLGLHFKGIIGVILIDGKEYRIGTYLGARLVWMKDNSMLVKQGKFVFYAKLIQPQHQKLNAPESGKMERIIHESVSCKAYYKFMYENKLLLELVSDEASFEYEMDCI